MSQNQTDCLNWVKAEPKQTLALQHMNVKIGLCIKLYTYTTQHSEGQTNEVAIGKTCFRAGVEFKLNI